MEAILVSGFGMLSVAVLIYMLIKKNDVKMTLLGLGIFLMYAALFLGKTIKITMTTGSRWLDPFQAVIERFSDVLVGPGFVILILGGYSAYMSHIGANQITVHALTKPLHHIRSLYILVPIVFLLGNLLSLVIPSASNLAIILLTTLYPVLRTAGMSRLTAAAIIGTTATIIPTPLGSDNVAVANELGMPVAQYVFQYHAIVSLPTLLLIAVIHYLWQKRADRKNQESLSYQDELATYSPSEKPQPLGNLSKASYLLYSILPVLPILILLFVFICNGIWHTKLNLSAQIVSLLSFTVAVPIELFRKRQIKSVLNGTNAFFTGMGNAMGIVALTFAAQTFVKGLTSIGVIDLVQNTMKQADSAGILLPIILVAFTAVIVLLTGDGTAVIFALIPLIVPLAKAAGVQPEALSVPVQLSGNLLRSVSPVAAVIVIVAGATHLSPMKIIYRTSVPMFAGVFISLILSLLLF
ncbi:MAG: C4-dicarboxylate transporter DcuC [Schleiferilactobacillus perolens]|uniref:C4-dicarboxylate transporter DcuC n=1 Tax=Schleiferilactobacillus perolens TaxID=100468 RepID=UPI0039ED996D